MIEKKETMPANEAMAINQNYMAAERTELSKVRSSLALNNSRLAAERTHLSYLRTIVTLLGSAATLYQALPCSASVKFLPPALPPSCFLQPPSLFTRMPPLIPGSKRNSPRLNSVSHF